MISLLKGTDNWTIILAVQDSVKRESGRCNQKALSTVRFTMGSETHKSYVDQTYLFILENSESNE